MPLVIGATAADFNIVRPLAYEEFGDLYVAEHPRLPRQQVLHLIPTEFSVDLDYRPRFFQLSDQAARLWHPSIAGLTDRGEFEDQLWISSEYIDGPDAADLLGDGHLDGMPPRMVVEIVTAIADALDYASDNGVLHGYVNPGTIVVGKSPADRRRIALVGFGVARPEGAHNTLTRAGMFIGTAGYTAPEQLMGDDRDGRADQYSLAASAFHLLTGAPPFAHFNSSVVVNRQLNDRAPRPSEIRPDLTEFDAVFARALSKDPVDRFRRARDFAKALESIGGSRSHVRATAEVPTASMLRETASDNGHAAAMPPVDPTPATNGSGTNGSGVNGSGSNGSKHAAVQPTLPEPVPVDETRPVPTSHQRAETDDDPSDKTEILTAATPPTTQRVVSDDDSAAQRRRRRQHTAAIAGAIAVVVVAWFAGVRALRSASEHDDTPGTVESSTTEPTTSAISAPRLVPPPLPVAPPVATTAPPRAVAPTTTAPATTTKRAPSSTAAQTAPTSASRPATPTTSLDPKALDTRPAVGMPCPAEGAAAVSNSGGPVTCVSTPGGSAWEPPGS